MTPDQIDIALALGNCRLQLGSRNKRFALDTAEIARRDDARAHELTVLQEDFLYRLAIMYRRRMPPELVTMAGMLLTTIQPLVDDELARRKREADDRVAKRHAMKRARERVLPVLFIERKA